MKVNINVPYIGTLLPANPAEFPRTVVRVLYEPEPAVDFDIPYHKMIQICQSSLDEVRDIYFSFTPCPNPIREYTVVRRNGKVYTEVLYTFPYGPSGEKRALQFAQALSEL